MAFDFKVSLRWKDRHLHLIPRGDFDGGSAQELLSILKRTCPGASRVFIHTGSLGRVDPFGRDIFLKNFRIGKKPDVPVIFTGDKGSEIAPELKNVFVFYSRATKPRLDRIQR
jgi:hypothetical protein